MQTCASHRKKLFIRDTPVIDQEASYARVIGLLISNRSLDFNVILTSGLSAYPPWMFDPTGHTRLAKSKSTLKKSLQGDIPTRAIESNVTVIDGSAVLSTIDWPANGTVQSFIDRVKYYAAAKLKDHDIHMIFDSHWEYSHCSSNSTARKDRSTCSMVHQLNRDFPLPPRDVVLSVTKTRCNWTSSFFRTSRRIGNTYPTPHIINWCWLDKTPLKHPFLNDKFILSLTWLPLMKRQKLW